VRRQQEEDALQLLPTIRHLNERQYQLFALFQSVIARHRPEGFTRLVDVDVAEAAGAMAATLETAGRGLIYEHTPQSRPAQSVAGALKTVLAQMREQGTRVYDGEAALALRAIEQGARALTRPDRQTAYLELVGRLLQLSATEVAEQEPPARSSLILP
jgi:hypothetical protein